ncbi:uncharacterized protein BDZ99DRAFT_461402 [Mytilinidion resinicola]|uniref:Uncharacterized protein n=1 Tax=Mytilinidion resinicola TaxID=574789 RepID=A0A6A6YV10_9PEZI|nr:uncharacterized protein BDZ99DRAFT_461402 [Mytilinidion resinicola]KAF2812772.1 hypothetical protein BDZ99DRAFT_461402 [Mytilinidion resinicola]
MAQQPMPMLGFGTPTSNYSPHLEEYRYMSVQMAQPQGQNPPYQDHVKVEPQ